MGLTPNQDPILIVWLVLYPLLLFGDLIGCLGQMTIANNPSSAMAITNPTVTTTQNFKVNTMQTSSSKNPQQLGGKRNIKGKSKKDSSEEGVEQAQQPFVECNKNNHKVKYPCMICKEDHFTKYCPHLTKVHEYIEQDHFASQPVVLTNPFHSYQKKYFPKMMEAN